MTSSFNSSEEKLCNLCGETCYLDKDIEASGLIDAFVNGGYFSTAGNGYGALDDCTRYKFSICEFCLDWLFEQFVIPVKCEDWHDGIQTWTPAAERVEKDDWRKMKDIFLKEYNKRKAVRKL